MSAQAVSLGLTGVRPQQLRRETAARPCRGVRHRHRLCRPHACNSAQPQAREQAAAATPLLAAWRNTGVAVCAAAAVLLCCAAQSGPAGAVEAELPLLGTDDETLMSDFDVKFLGQKVDHRVIVEWVVAGQTVGFIGAAVTGLSLRERKREVEELNTRLVQVNKQLREKARSSQTALQHATSGGSSEEGDSAGAASAVPDDPTTEKVLTTLRAAKSMLKLRDSTGAKAQFEQALALVQQHEASLESPWKAKRKALRGLGAACQQLGDHDAALRHLQQVLYISEEHGDVSGAADAIGVIADCYTDKGDLDNAGKWYDRYIEATR